MATHLHLVSSWRMNGVIPPLPLYSLSRAQRWLYIHASLKDGEAFGKMRRQAISSLYECHRELENKRPTWCHLLFYFTYVLNVFRTLTYPSSGACDSSVELPHWSYCSWFDVCWSFGVVGLEWYPCCRLKCVRCGWCRAPSAPYTAALKTTTHPKTRCRKPYAATQHLMLLMMGVCTRNMSS